MSNLITKKMLALYESMAEAPMFLSSFFRSPPENFHNSENVEIDVVRSGRDIAIVVQDLSVEGRMNTMDVSTNKEFTPPIFDEIMTLNSADLIKRVPGENPFQDPMFRGNVASHAVKAAVKMTRKIRRSVELQASQVLQTGIITLADSAGTTLYSLDFAPKATHFPTVSVSWSSASATIEQDLVSLADVIRADGNKTPTELMFGDAAWRNFANNAAIQALLDNRRMTLGSIAPRPPREDGGLFMGTVQLGSYSFDMYTYSGSYTNPNGGADTKYIGTDNVIMRAGTGRLDATFGSIPNIGKALGVPGTSLVPEMPARLSLMDGAMDVFPHVWLSPNGKQLHVGVGSRPLLIPTAIDTYGCLDTTV